MTPTKRFLEEIMTIAERDGLWHRVITEEVSASTLSHRSFLAATLATGILSSLPASRRTPGSVWSAERER